MARTKRHTRRVRTKPRKYPSPWLYGTKYCGPDNTMDLGAPLNALDEACYWHDWSYGKYGAGAKWYHSDADQRLLDAAWAEGGPRGAAVLAIFYAKKTARMKTLPFAEPSEYSKVTEDKANPRNYHFFDQGPHISKRFTDHLEQVNADPEMKRRRVSNTDNSLSAYAGGDILPHKSFPGVKMKKLKKYEYPWKKHTLVGSTYSSAAGKCQTFEFILGNRAEFSAQVDDEFQQISIVSDLANEGASYVQRQSVVNWDLDPDISTGGANKFFHFMHTRHLRFKNNTAAPAIQGSGSVFMEVNVFRCLADTDNTPLSFFNDAISTAQGSTAPASSTLNPIHRFKNYARSSQLKKNWEAIGYKKWILKPGQESSFSVKCGIVANPKNFANETMDYMKGTVVYVIRTIGDIAHLTATPLTVLYDASQLDIIQRDMITCGIKDGNYRRYVTNTNTVSISTNATTDKNVDIDS